MSVTRQLHGHILMRVQLALGRRSWSWLAREAGVPQSTLASQAAKPKFSVEVLVRIATALDRPITYFLPGPEANDAVKRAADDALAQIEDIIARARERAS
jgi:transcriptional regulator with XRE-family HTH domain